VRSWLGWILVPLLAFLALGSWALSSPVGATPDEDYHLTSIWCGLGEREPFCEPGDTSIEKSVPATVLQASLCFAFRSDASAACQTGMYDDESSPLVSTERGNFQGDYPPGFYFASGLLASEGSYAASVVMMRLMNAAIFVIMLSVAARLLPRELRFPLIGSVLGASVPLVVFLVPSINPTSWAITSAATLWITLLGAARATTARQRWSLMAVAIVAAVLGVSSRGDSAAFVAIGAFVAVLLHWKWTERPFVSLLLPGVAAVAGFLGFLGSSQTDSVSEGLPGAGGEPLPPSVLLGSNFIEMPGLYLGALGGDEIGWGDTPLPSTVLFASFAVVVALAVVGAGALWRRKVAAIAVVLVLLIALPMVIFYSSNATVGNLVQPRYMLPLMIVLIGLLLLPPPGGLRPTRVLAISAALMLSSAQSIALHTNLRRYVTGLDAVGWNLDIDAEWWWPIAVSPNGVWIIGSLCFGAVAVVLAYLASERRLTEAPRRRPADDPSARPLAPVTP